mmetsp:Transcript_5/g.17  ORF Transcript_5/g.17 Transcript_5/m.17 type:complete len:88 (+) Transcript_5:1216-1479(+)
MTGVNLTSSLEEVTHAIEEHKSNEQLIKSDIQGFERYLKKWERFAKSAQEADLGFTPLKIRIESRLALTVFYVCTTVAVTVYIELTL